MLKVIFLIQKIVPAIVRRIRNIISLFWWKLYLKSVGKKSKIYRNVKFLIPSNVSIGRNCLIDTGVNFSSEIETGTLEIKNNVKININVFLDYSGGVIVSDNVVISRDTYIVSHSHGYDPLSIPKPKPLIIEEGVWIGAKVTICENVTIIGKNSLIAAGAVVTKDVKPNTIVGGNPAKLIKVKS
ncbi:acyltransferase [Aquimarina agarilytica]|uniref:acyltransferase n=1 Tax=Aquimarina agarilytica TaxID=1087449 RepID=UPI000288A745|nr:DapH/DapD/GlmU-related protein [Aquimarina agarilytica]